MIDMKKSKSSHDLKDLAGSVNDDNAIAILEKISKLKEAKDYNIIALVNKPFVGHVLAAMMLSLNHCMTSDFGRPQIDFESFNKLKNSDKLTELNGLFRSIGGMIDTLHNLKIGLISFAEDLIEIEKNIKAKIPMEHFDPDV